MTYTQSRYRWGKLNDAEPSRFLTEIDPSFIDNRVVESNYEFKPLVDPSNFGDDQPMVRYKKPPTKSIPKRVPKNLKPVSTSSQSPAAELAGLEVGARISHNRFGVGTIVSIEGNGGDAKALIDFDANGRKNLLLRFAKFDIL